MSNGLKQELKEGLASGLQEILLVTVIVVPTLFLFGGIGYLIGEGWGLVLGTLLGIVVLFIAFWIAVVFSIKNAFTSFRKK